MKTQQSRLSLDGRLAAYMAAAGTTAVAATSAEGVVVTNSTVQPFGVNGAVSIDFNSDGQTDFQIDHDRVNVPGVGDLDYLQIDKNDFNGETNPTAFDPFTGFQMQTFPPGATTPNDANEAAYVIGPLDADGSYPAALTQGTLIGPASNFDWQESANFSGTKDIRANRLLDEDQTQIDQVLGGQPASEVQVPFNGPNFDGLAGAVRYLGLKMELNNSGLTNYGWVGIRIDPDNEADAVGEVVGYAYETLPGVPILAGNVPEPGTLIMGATGALAMLGAAALRRFRRK